MDGSLHTYLWDGASKSRPLALETVCRRYGAVQYKERAERKLEEWRRAMEERGLKISRRETEYVGCNEHQDAELHLQGDLSSKESEYIHIHGIDVGGGWRTGCESHPPSAERVEELEESVWSVV